MSDDPWDGSTERRKIPRVSTVTRILKNGNGKDGWEDFKKMTMYIVQFIVAAALIANFTTLRALELQMNTLSGLPLRMEQLEQHEEGERRERDAMREAMHHIVIEGGRNSCLMCKNPKQMAETKLPRWDKIK